MRGQKVSVRQTKLSTCTAESSGVSTMTGSVGNIITTIDLTSPWEAFSDEGNDEDLETKSSASVSKGDLLGHAADAAMSAVGSAVFATATGLLLGNRAIGHIILAKAKEDTHFLG